MHKYVLEFLSLRKINLVYPWCTPGEHIFLTCGPDVTPTHKDVYNGKETVLSCKVTGLEAKATVSWTKGNQTVDGSTEGELIGNTQISTLTVINPQEDTEYTCVVSSGRNSLSKPSETLVSLNVYATEVSSKGVLINTETSLACKIKGITEEMSIEWTGFDDGDDNYVPSSGSYDSVSNSQTGTLTVKSAAVTSNKMYTCTVSSLQNTESDKEDFEVHLYVYDFSLIDWKGRDVGVGVRGLLIVNEGTVCNDDFSNNSANSICRKMGYSGQISWTSANRWKMQDDRPIAMDDVFCNSGEWSSCSYSWSHNCNHSKDVFLQCQGVEYDTWNPVIRETFLSANLETLYLHMKTNSSSSSSVGNRQNIKIWFYDTDLYQAGSFYIWFLSTYSVKYLLGECMRYYTSFPVRLPADQQRTWMISKRGKTIKVYCNGKMVLEVAASSEICDNPEYSNTWASYYGREANAIYFPITHTASDSYYIGTDVPKCTGLDAKWSNIVASNDFPVLNGTKVILRCEDGYHQFGDSEITCHQYTQFYFVTEPKCSLTTPDADFSLIDWKGRDVGVGVRGLLIVNEGTVCNDDFSNNSANAICRRMGFSGQISWTSTDKWKMQDDRTIGMDDVFCNSGEWSSCSYSWSHNCDHSKDVFLQCQGIEQDTWSPVIRERFLDAKLETSYLHMTTSISFVENRQNIKIWFYDTDLYQAGSFYIWFVSTYSVKYLLGECMQYYTSFPVSLPADQQRTWMISKRGKTIKVYCNGKMVLEVAASSEICDNPEYSTTWATYYGREANTIYLPITHTASDSYYIGAEVPEKK